MLELACEKWKLEKDRVLMVGDRLDTDILFGINGGVRTLFVTETGINSREDVEKTGIRPTYITTDVSKMMEDDKVQNDAQS